MSMRDLFRWVWHEWPPGLVAVLIVAILVALLFLFSWVAS